MEAFEEIVKDHSQKIYYFLRKMSLDHEDADEIVQDIFILLWRDLQSGHGLDAIDFRLYQHAIKKVLSFLNKTSNMLLKDSSIKDQLIFVLKHHEGFDYGDISEMTGLNIADVRSSFNSAVKM